MKLRLLGDVHGVIQPVIRNYHFHHQYDQLIQLGDFGFRDTYKHLDKFDPTRLRILAGNHDDYDAIEFPEYKPYFLGDYGLLPGSEGRVFFVRGAWSIDKAFRREGISWWHNEELSYKEANDCLDYWEKNCQNVELVLSHDAPINVVSSLLKFYPKETTTGKLLYEMLKIHEPQRWFFAHHHVQFKKKIGNCIFQCVDINQAIDIEV